MYILLRMIKMANPENQGLANRVTLKKVNLKVKQALPQAAEELTTLLGQWVSVPIRFQSHVVKMDDYVTDEGYYIATYVEKKFLFWKYKQDINLLVSMMIPTLRTDTVKVYVGYHPELQKHGIAEQIKNFFDGFAQLCDIDSIVVVFECGFSNHDKEHMQILLNNATESIAEDVEYEHLKDKMS